MARLVWLHTLSLLAVLGSACGSTPASEPGTSPTQGSTPAALRPQPASAALEVHEWGVIDVPPSGPAEIAAGPGRPVPERPMPMRKPVLYFHLDPGAAPIDVDVTARIPHGSMLEVWPAGELGADSIAWSRVHVAPCPTPLPSTRSPELRGERWATRDGYNEVLELPNYETDDAACLTSGSTAARLLFYRGSLVTPRLPLEVVRDAQGQRVMRAWAPGEGNVILTAAGGRGITLPWPAVGVDVVLPDAFTESLEGAQLARTLERDITQRGLTTAEAAAFMRAWSMPFFGVAADAMGASGPRRDIGVLGQAPTRRALPEQPPSLLYLMPDATVSTVAELTITPLPRAVRRAMVVRIELGPR